MNIGEEICGEWLRHVKGCEFVQYNVRTPDVHRGIDVIGIPQTKILGGAVCEQHQSGMDAD